jgi:hypothetical protein
MGAGKGGGFIRYSKYMFPFVDCVIRLYSELGKPVPISDVEDCMRDIHALRSTGGQYEGRDAALDNGFVIGVPVGRRTRYVPTMEGVVSTGLYFGLLNVTNDIPVGNIPCLLKLLRINLGLNRLWFAFTMLWLKNQAAQAPSNTDNLAKEMERLHIYFMNFVTAKALLGIEIRDLNPMYYKLVMDTIKGGIVSLFKAPLPSGGKIPINLNFYLKLITKACGTIRW